ncbi:SGNH hydrolase domain-containing protein, partial [Candidatus Pelagibacter sp.]|nr:SGNH hydrolase domain-containing protein [Candidatus Pelagibacter sp.]
NSKKCQRYSLLNEFDCRFNINGKNDEVILLGTSALAAFSNSLTSRLIKNDYKVSVITPPGCPYVLDFYHYNRISCNEEYMKKIQNYLNDTKKPAIVIYLARYAYYINGKLKHEKNADLNLPILMSKSQKNISLGFKDTFIDILDQGHKLLLIYPLPEINKHVPKEYKKKIYKNNFNLVLPYKNYLARTDNISKIFNTIQHKNLYRFFPSKYLCRSSNYCITKINDKILYTDYDHLSINGSEFLSPLILETPIFKLN